MTVCDHISNSASLNNSSHHILCYIVYGSIISFLNKYLNITLFFWVCELFFPISDMNIIECSFISRVSVPHMLLTISALSESSRKRSYIINNSKELAKVEKVKTMHKH